MLRADVLFRAIPLPAGSQEPHEVELVYRSAPLERGVPISIASIVVTACLALPAAQRLTSPRPLSHRRGEVPGRTYGQVAAER